MKSKIESFTSDDVVKCLDKAAIGNKQRLEDAGIQIPKMKGKFNIDMDQLKTDLEIQGRKDRDLFHPTKRLTIEVGDTFTFSSSVPYKQKYTDSDVIEYLEEIIRMLKAPTIKDDDIF